MAVYCDACKQIDHWIEKSLYSNEHDGYRNRKLILSTSPKHDSRRLFGKSLWGKLGTILANMKSRVFVHKWIRYKVTSNVVVSFPGSPTTASVCSSCEAFSKLADNSYFHRNVDYTELHNINLELYSGTNMWLEMESPSTTDDFLLCILQPKISGSISMRTWEFEDKATVHRYEIFNRDFINLNLARQWLDTCITIHDTCKLPVQLHLKKLLYLIDVKYECIVQLFASDTEYTALSYVWGNSNVTKATSSNIRDLMKPGALSKRSNIIIPLTIRDAMFLTQSLGKQYIWVDSLCILQDDRQLQGYLDQMAYIYANACVTIIMADGENADHGIKGIRENGDQRQMPDFIIDLPSCSLITCETRFERTTWASRGWTFQEGLFSNRAIYICGGFLSWKCGAGTTSELGPLADDMRGYLEMNVVARGEYEKGMNLFPSLVENFNNKDFTYEVDAVKAFSGLSTVMSSTNNNRIFFGLPLEDFRRHLLWIPSKPLKRRDLCRDTSLGFANVPTWSWLAWKGELNTVLWNFRRSEFTTNMIVDLKKRCKRCSRNVPGLDCCLCSDDVSSSLVRDFEPIVNLHGWQAILAIRRNGLNHYLAYHITNQKIYGGLVFNSIYCVEHHWKHGSVLSPGHNPPYRFLAIGGFTLTRFERYVLKHSFNLQLKDDQLTRMVVALCISPIEGNAHGICERIGIAIFPRHVWDSFPKEEVDLLLG